MLSAFKRLTKVNDDRDPAPVPMSLSLQKKFSRGVHFNMKILIKGDRNVGKTCLLQRLQGKPFVEEYVPTDQIQVAPIHWTYKDTDHIIKVEVWEVVDKGRAKKKIPVGLKLENQTPSLQDEAYDAPILDATFLDVYKNASGVILMLDITKPWTFDYVVKELSQVPSDLPVIILGNHCDMQHHRQVHSHHIDQALHQAKQTRTAPIRYAESSMRNGFGLRLLHKFLSVPFLRLQETSLLEQLARNRKDVKDVEKELDDFQNSDEAHYDSFVERLASRRREGGGEARSAVTVASERSPSIVLGAGKPIVPTNVNALVAQSLNPLGIKAQHGPPLQRQTQYVSPESISSKNTVNLDVEPSTAAPKESTTMVANSGDGALDDFYAGALDSSFLDDLASPSVPGVVQETNYGSDSEDENATNPQVTTIEDDLDDYSPLTSTSDQRARMEYIVSRDHVRERLEGMLSMAKDSNIGAGDASSMILEDVHNMQLHEDDDFTLWVADSSARRSPEGGEDPDLPKEPVTKTDKKPKKKKSKDKEREDRKDRRHKSRRSRGEESPPTPAVPSLCDYDAI